jgi:hypothetical protein
MVITKALALWLFIVGLVWAAVTAWTDLVMTGMTDRIVSFPVFLVLYFSAPFILIIGSSLVMATWHSRLGSILVLVGCAWLTWSFAPTCVEAFRFPSEMGSPATYIIGTVLCLILVAADATAIILFRRTKPSNQTLQPTTGRSDV